MPKNWRDQYVVKCLRTNKKKIFIYINLTLIDFDFSKSNWHEHVKKNLKKIFNSNLNMKSKQKNRLKFLTKRKNQNI